METLWWRARRVRRRYPLQLTLLDLHPWRVQIKKGDIIVTVDGEAATYKTVDSLMRGEDVPVTPSPSHTIRGCASFRSTGFGKCTAGPATQLLNSQPARVRQSHNPVIKPFTL